MVNHLIWKQGKVIEVNEEKGEYKIKFTETGKTKPITFEFRGLSKIEKTVELTEEEKIEKSKSDKDWNSFVEYEIENNESQKSQVVEPTEITETSSEEKKELIRERINDLKEEKEKLEKIKLENSESELITESEIIENRTVKINETEEEIVSPPTHKSNGGNSAKPKGKDKNNLWSKLKGFWS